jgi:hypothetical protein
VKSFKYRDLSTGVVGEATAKYRDIAPLGPRQEVIQEGGGGMMGGCNGERQSLYCISVPGEAPWVAEEHRKTDAAAAAGNPAVASGSALKKRMKRNHDEEEAMADAPQEEKVADVEMCEGNGDAATEKKRAKTEAAQNGSLTQTKKVENALNLPIPSARAAKAAIVKIYDDGTATDASFSLNECYEFVGIVSLDPSLAAFPTDGTENDVMEQFGQQERLAKSPPPSLVPRIHVVAHHKLNHGNPLLPQKMELQAGMEDLFTFLHILLTWSLCSGSMIHRLNRLGLNGSR